MGCTFGEESLLDVLLLAQWEDRDWKGLARYDVTSCETKDNPIEYGRVFLAPFAACSLTHMVDLKSVELALQIAAEVSNSPFRVCYSTGAVSPPFQACYLANPFPVEIVSGVSLLGSSQGGIEVCELTDYPIKSLLFKSQQNVRRMVELVAKISSCLQAQDILFNLLISDGGNKVFLFPQVPTSISGNKLTAWECAGHFVFRQESDFIEATEEDIAKRLAISSLDDAAFQALKQLCRAVACKLICTVYVLEKDNL